MKQVKKCKYPTCNKEVYGEHSLFCLEHSRGLKDKGKKACAIISTLTISVTGLIGLIVDKKK